MDQREPVHEDRHIISVLEVALFLFVLVDDLEEIVVDILLVDQGDVLCRPIVPLEDLHAVFLDPPALFLDPFIRVGNVLGKESFPFIVRESKFIELFKLPTEVRDHVFRFVDLQVLIPLLREHLDKGRLQGSLALVGVRPFSLRFVFCYDRTLTGGKDNVILARSPTSFKELFSCFFFEGQQLVPVILILLLARLDFDREAGGKVVTESIETIQNIYNSFNLRILRHRN